jgi:two-component system sensor histidine kinase CpxA
MKNLFRGLARSPKTINLWLLFVLLLGVGVCLAVSDGAVMFHTLERDMNSLCVTTYRAYQRDGRSQLASILRWVEDGLQTRAYLVDSHGRDLATGDDRSSLLAKARSTARVAVQPQPILLIAPAPSYACLVEPLRRPLGLPVGPMTWVLGFLLISCCTIAVYLTLRMRRIEVAVSHFGSGHLDARVAADSGDPIGRISTAFNRMADRIQTIVVSQQRLCDDISHELRSPLARLLLALRIAKRGSPEVLERIEKEVGRVNQLLDELLELAYLEAAPGALHVENVDLESILSEIVARCVTEAVEQTCTIELKFSNPGALEADPELLWRAVENVLRNAVRYSPADAVIDLTAGGDAESVVITVRDRGRGVPDCSLSDIFTANYRVERKRESGSGVGLGLAIAQRAVTLQGGTISAHNCLPGLCVEIRLPRRRMPLP